jgi:rod shape determining protein RodA
MASITMPTPLTRRATASGRKFDFVLLLSTMAAAGIGLLMVYSATRANLAESGGDAHSIAKKQALWIVLGMIAMVVAAVFDYRWLLRFAPVTYGAMAVVLLAVLTPLGSVAKGTQAWFQIGPFQLQPSEFAKLGLIVGVAAYCHAHRGDLDAYRLAVTLGIAAIPLALVSIQPDLGTAMVLGVILLTVVLVAGARGRHLLVLALFALTGIGVVIHAGALKQYQVDRLTGFLDQSADSSRATYNLEQSKIAISHGGITGQGLFEGTQTNLSYVPEQHTDFIFTVVGEELGFLGGLTLLALFAAVLWRTWRTAQLSHDLFGALLCIGVLGMFAFQIFENVGMTMGIMPITGIPLPFVSYGGSSTITCFAAVGLVLNVSLRR